MSPVAHPGLAGEKSSWWAPAHMGKAIGAVDVLLAITWVSIYTTYFACKYNNLYKIYFNASPLQNPLEVAAAPTSSPASNHNKKFFKLYYL